MISTKSILSTGGFQEAEHNPEGVLYGWCKTISQWHSATDCTDDNSGDGQPEKDKEEKPKPVKSGMNMGTKKEENHRVKAWHRKSHGLTSQNPLVQRPMNQTYWCPGVSHMTLLGPKSSYCKLCGYIVNAKWKFELGVRHYRESKPNLSRRFVAIIWEESST